MRQIPRGEFIDCLENNWGAYLDRYYRLPPDGQQAFLNSQGYATLGGLLGHIVAWWQDGMRMIVDMCSDTSIQNPDYDVDSFNANAVKMYAALSDREAAQLFQTQRQAMADLVTSLSDGNFCQENINTRLYYEILQHWNEHEIL